MSDTKGKTRFPLWLQPETLAKVKELYKENDCKSQSEFIERAVRFYIGYLTAGDPANYLPNMFLSTMKAIVAESDSRLSRMLFKLTVELAIVMNLVAADHQGMSDSVLSALRAECIDEVKRVNGDFSFEDAIHWQRYGQKASSL